MIVFIPVMFVLDWPGLMQWLLSNFFCEVYL
jgi:hypothetical protein